MATRRPYWHAAGTLFAVTLAAVPVLAQTLAAKSDAATEADAAPVPESGAADPLTPKSVDVPAPLAPGAPVPSVGAAPSAAAEPDPVMGLVRQRTAALGAQKAIHRDDLVAVQGFYAEAAKPVWIDRAGLNPRGGLVLAEIALAEDWGLKAASFELPLIGEATIEALAEAEVKLSLAVLKYARHARGGRLDPSSVSRKFDQRPVVFEPKSVLQAIAVTDAADAYLRGLHPKHAQFERLRQAMLAARAVKADGAAPARGAPSVPQIVANMERWRWMPPELGKFHVWSSIPEQMTYVIDGGKPVLAEKIVVGKLSSPTPVFSADMQFVIFNPSWGVPPGMKSNELWPQLRATGGGGWFSSKPLASSVLQAHGLRVTRGGAPVNPDTVDWNAVDIRNFEFEQPPGPANVLGAVKFRFPNRHDVYMHDTPERHLFGGSVRAFSHGCMRVQNPMRLAEVLLAHDKGWPAERVRQAQRGGEIRLTSPIPVHVTYFTVTVDDAGHVQTRPDLYGLEARVVAALDGRDAGAMSTSSIPAAAEKPARAKVVQKKQREREKTAQTPETPPWNPMSALFGN
jgi:murein L,D-transpeptidase YcbB/YkuD